MAFFPLLKAMGFKDEDEVVKYVQNNQSVKTAIVERTKPTPPKGTKPTVKDGRTNN